MACISLIKDIQSCLWGIAIRKKRKKKNPKCFKYCVLAEEILFNHRWRIPSSLDHGGTCECEQTSPRWKEITPLRISWLHPHTLYTHFISPVTHWMQRWKLGVVWPFHLVKMLGSGLSYLDNTMTFWIQDDYIISIKVTVTGLFLYSSLIQAVRHGGTWWFLCGSFLFQSLYFQVRGHGPLPVDAGYLNAPLERD